MKTLIIAALAASTLAACAPQPTREEMQIAAVQEAVRAQLRDPQSAQFTNVRKSRLAICGEVNSKNAYGGYAGAERFYGFSTDQQTVVVLQSTAPTIAFFEEGWAKDCEPSQPS